MDAKSRLKVVNSIAKDNLAAWRASGVVHTLKVWSAEDGEVCESCKMRNATIVQIQECEIGVNLPPFTDCKEEVCRCYFRPEEISI